MSVATHVQALVVEAVVAGKGYLRVDAALLQAGERLRYLERRAWGIGAHNGAVKQGAHWVFAELLMVLAAVAPRHDARVVGGRRRHAEYLARLRFYGHDGAELALEQTFGKGLQVLVEAEREVLPGLRLCVVLAVLIVSLRAAVHVAEHDAHALLPAQLFLVGALYAEFANVVAGGVVVGGVLQEFFFADFAHIAEQVGGDAAGILPGGAFLHAEPLETEKLFAEQGELLSRNLRHEELRRIARIAGIAGRVFYLLHALDVVLAAYAHGLAKIKRVHAALVVHHYHNVVGRLVVHEYTPLAIEDKSARGVLYVFAKGVGVGVFLVVLTPQLQGEEPHDVGQHYGDGHAANDVFAQFEAFF